MVCAIPILVISYVYSGLFHLLKVLDLSDQRAIRQRDLLTLYNLDAKRLPFHVLFGGYQRLRTEFGFASLARKQFLAGYARRHVQS